LDSVLGIGLVVLILSIWVTIKTIELVVRMLAAHPRSFTLWGALCGLCICISAAALAPEYEAPLLLVGSLSGLVLLGIAKTQELRDDPLLQIPRTRAMLVDEVLHSSWWSA
jgi:hypothetical protein